VSNRPIRTHRSRGGLTVQRELAKTLAACRGLGTLASSPAGATNSLAARRRHSGRPKESMKAASYFLETSGGPTLRSCSISASVSGPIRIFGFARSYRAAFVANFTSWFSGGRTWRSPASNHVAKRLPDIDIARSRIGRGRSPTEEKPCVRLGMSITERTPTVGHTVSLPG